ncbi:CHAT domain-containing protein [Coleofasciculus sp. FACHB-64]|uniref:CHAT domain-containing protein n=1 Tax=Cyanophyceae TaxID=3028117 RepID=UPI001F54F948|nr:CHAT domain-containing protein [Coleofasciculus sp. FACHB-64]
MQRRIQATSFSQLSTRLKTIMLSDKSRKAHRSLTILMGVVFATAYSIPINAQPRTPIPSQSPTIENSKSLGTRQPVQAFGGQLAVFVGHESYVHSAVFSPDGRQILTVSGDKTARLWGTKGNLLAVLQGHEGFVHSAVFSPDGQQILTVSQENETARLWDSQGNLLSVLRGHEDSVTSASFSPNGRQILTASKDNTARLWDSQGNLLSVLRGHEGFVHSAVFSPDGQQILTVSQENETARLWDSQGNLLSVLRGHEDSVTSASFSPNGRQILTASKDNTARLWDSQGNLLSVLRGHEGWVYSAVFSSNGRQILTASDEDKNARLWDSQGNLLAVLRGHEDSLKSVVFSPNGRYILTASDDKTARLWDSQGNLLAVLRGHEYLVTSASFSPDGRQILTASIIDSTAQLWDSQGNLLAVLGGQGNEVYGAVFSPDGHQILTAGSDKTARLWDVSDAIAAQSEQMTTLQAFQSGVSKKNAQLAVLQGHEYGINSAVFSPDGRQILTASGDGTAQLWDNQSNLLSVFRGHEDDVYNAVFSPDGRQILTASKDNTARLWDSKGNLLSVLRGHEYSVTNALFSPDGRQILTTSIEFSQLWDSQGNLLAVLRGHEGFVHSAVFSPNGQYILTASSDKTARLWNTKGTLLAVLQGHEKSINNAVFSPDGRQILTVSGDKTARLWDSQGNLLSVLQGHEYSVISASFSPDGRQILTAGSDKTARLWDSQGNLLSVLRGHDRERGVNSASFSPDGQQILTASDESPQLWDSLGKINSAVFSPDGRQILTASANKTPRLWDSQGNLLAVLRGHEDFVTSASFSPDGRQILTGSGDSTARLWDVSAAIAAQAEQMTALQAFQAGVSEKNAQQAATALEEGIQLNQQGTLESRQLAIQKLEEALKLYRADKNHAKAAQTLLLIGNIYADFGQFQTAIDSYNQALPLSRQAGAKEAEAYILNSLGQLYNDLADPKTALNYYNQALPLFYQLIDKGAVATTFNNIGDIHTALGEWQDVLHSYNKALIVSRSGGSLGAEATALAGIGSTYIASQEWSTALNAYNQALLISRHLNDKVKETTILNQLGKIHAALGQKSTAIDYYNQALTLSQQLGYKTEEANILYNQAILNRQQNNLTAAKTEIETAINIIESLRTQIASQELRQSYFARNQDYYQFYIDLLMQLHQQNPNQGYAAEALHISERARARSLIELLSEASANIRSGVDPKLLEQERTLQQQLNNFEHRKYQLQSGQHTQNELDEFQQKIDTVLAQLKQLEAQIRVASPRYADLKYPEPLNLQQIQQQVLDDKTILLEYSLGEERSYLWAVTQNSITSYVLPKRSEIETAVQAFRKSLTPNSVAHLETGLPLSQMLLAPVANQLGNKRLLVIGDGALQYVPFAALPIPSAPTTPLLVQNEIITLPSASTVAIQRRQLENRPIAAKSIAVVADPIFNLNDSRIAGTPPQQTPDTLSSRTLTRAARNLGLGDSGRVFDRLQYTRTEAEKILALVPEQQRLQALDFNASRATATDPNLAQYQIIHLATHGLLDPINPELSGIVLSLYDQNGKSLDGFLRLHDIFNLNLPVELVVLSACETGLGQEVKGEGLVGLTRGFMYAGSRRVVVSLWSVNDAATSKVMTNFYQKMLQLGQNPVAALRAAQLEMWNSGQWQAPYYWAAFTIQGDWR